MRLLRSGTGPNYFLTNVKIGARTRTRTGTVFLPRDFKSLASTNFAIRALFVDV